VEEEQTQAAEPETSPPEEVVNGLPVLAETRALTQSEGMLPARQAAALAVSGFAAGAATVALAHRRRSKVAAKGRGRRKKGGIVGEIVSSNSFLVDVHLIKRP